MHFGKNSGQSSVINVFRSALVGLFLVALAPLGAQDLSGAPDSDAMIKSLEKTMYPDVKVGATLTMDDGKGRRDTYGMVFFARDRNQKIIVRFTAPASSVGNDLLMIDQNVWVYDRASNRVLKIPSNQSFGGSDFSYGDVVRLNFSDNYTSKVVGQTDEAWKLNLEAKNRNAPYFRIELTVSKKDLVPLRGTCFAKSGSVVKDMVYGDVKDSPSGRKPMTLTVTSPANPGASTVMSLGKEELKSFPDQIFNKRNLETRMEETL